MTSECDKQREADSRKNLSTLIYASIATVRNQGYAIRTTHSFPVYYCIYNKDNVMPSKMSFTPDDDSLGRIDTLSAPPHTVASLKHRIMNAEGVINQTIKLFKDTDGEALIERN